MDYTNKALGLRVQTQIPLNVKSYCESEDSLKDLGLNNNLAYIYEKGLIVYCILEGTRYEWKEIEIGEVGLLPVNFIYPDNVIIFGIDYSNKEYNFVLYDNLSIETPDATSTVKGKLKLTNDLGGTADLPTTPTAIHKTGDESFTGVKTLTQSGIGQQGGFEFINNTDAPTSYSVKSINNSSGADFRHYNSNFGVSSYYENNSGGEAINVLNGGIGTGIIIGGSTSSSGMLLIGKNNNIGTFSLSKLGVVTSTEFVKTGGTAQQILIADGTVRELNPQKEIIANYILTNADDGYVIFINNGTTPVSITINTTVTIPNFSVGFIQEGSADVTFVGAGITLTNPIGLKSKGQGYQTFIEKKLSTSTYYLLGNTKV